LSETIETYQGIPAQLAVTAVDGATDLYLRATVFNGNGSPVPVAAVNLEHKLIGFYRAEVSLPNSGIYRAVYRNFLDAARTVVDPDREHDQDTILVRPLDVPRLGVAYDQITDKLHVEVTMSRQGQPLASSELVAAQVNVYDEDDNMLLAVSDLASDGQGVFRMSYTDPGLIPDHLYYVMVTVTTAMGTITANKGFHTTE
jgi:hypothetical protein